MRPAESRLACNRVQQFRRRVDCWDSGGTASHVCRAHDDRCADPGDGPAGSDDRRCTSDNDSDDGCISDDGCTCERTRSRR